MPTTGKRRTKEWKKGGRAGGEVCADLPWTVPLRRKRDGLAKFLRFRLGDYSRFRRVCWSVWLKILGRGRDFWDDADHHLLFSERRGSEK